ncbi:hypothetical protein [Halosegnis longus]|uniref:hypothetical protein n=1 Tax=Halosegnis longus TaxID=2216012 RepID=UPI00129E0A04|nr:hypothetical protein [Halosegnis longus]
MVSGEQFVDEAIYSAQSANTHMPEVDTAIATTEVNQDLTTFDYVIELDEAQRKVVEGRNWLIDSTIKPDLSPFEQTLYLDSDTYIANDVSELFGLLDKFDLAITRVPQQPPVPELPEPWHLYNCGVILYRDSQEVRHFLNRWSEIYNQILEDQEQPEDQPAFAKALYECDDLQWYTLPRRYNVRFPRRGVLADEAKIIHGRHPAGLDKVSSELNQSKGLRVFRERSFRFTPATVVYDRPTLRYSLENYVTEYGLWYTLKRASAYAVDAVLGTDMRKEIGKENND